VSFWFTRIAANTSSLSAFLTNRVGDSFLTLGMFAILWSLGNLDYATVFSLAPYINSDLITLIGICLLIGAMAKSAQLGLHVWLPQAMEGPTPVSALIHAATMVTAGVYLLIRSSPLIEYSSTVLLLCLWLGAMTTVFSSLIGLFQSDIKKIIAYSTMSQLGLMVIALGLSSYNIALFHLLCHAFYKAALFLGAGSVIHAVFDNQDLRRMGGLISFLPLTYSVMLIASLSLAAFPFLTGFYSKDFILESSFGQFSFSGLAVYVIATIGAIFTTLYSVKILYLTFLSSPRGPKVNYKNDPASLEGDFFMIFPLVVLALFSVFFGYFTKDLFIGIGTGFFTDNSIFIHPRREILIATEFAVPTFFKLLPFFLTILFSAVAIVLLEFFPELFTKFKLSNIGYYVFGFFNQRGFIEMLYNKYIVNVVLRLGGHTTKVLDKGSIEIIGPLGLEKVLVKCSKIIHSLSTGVVTSYGLYMVLGLVGYLISFHFLLNIKIILYIIFVLAIIFLSENTENRPRSSSFNSNMMSSILPLVGLIYRALARTFTVSCIYLKNKIKGISSEEIVVYSKNISTSNLSLFKMFKIVLGLIFLLIYIVTGWEFPDVFCQGMDTDGDGDDSGDDKKEGSGPTDNSKKSSNSDDSADEYLNKRLQRMHELMINHTKENFLKNIDEDLKANDLFFKDDSELSEAERKRRDELISQRDDTVDFLAKELETKAKLDNEDMKRDNSNAPSSSNKRNIIHAEESSKKRK
jgi:NADH-ubiquinone oxidoreductase chain 5